MRILIVQNVLLYTLSQVMDYKRRNRMESSTAIQV